MFSECNEWLFCVGIMNGEKHTAVCMNNSDIIKKIKMFSVNFLLIKNQIYLYLLYVLILSMF